MPATIVVAHGLVGPMQWCGLRFSAVGQRVNSSSTLTQLPPDQIREGMAPIYVSESTFVARKGNGANV